MAEKKHSAALADKDVHFGDTIPEGDLEVYRAGELAGELGLRLYSTDTVWLKGYESGIRFCEAENQGQRTKELNKILKK